MKPNIGSLRFASLLSLSLIAAACSENPSEMIRLEKEFTGCVTAEKFIPKDAVPFIRGSVANKHILTVEVEGLGEREVAVADDEVAISNRDTYDPGDKVTIKLAAFKPDTNDPRARQTVEERLGAVLEEGIGEPRWLLPELSTPEGYHIATTISLAGKEGCR